MWAAFSGSSVSSQPRGLPVSTEQKRQARVQTAPINMIVAVPAFQHSPMLGHLASSQTVARRCSRTTFFTPARSPRRRSLQHAARRLAHQARRGPLGRAWRLMPSRMAVEALRGNVSRCCEVDGSRDERNALSSDMGRDCGGCFLLREDPEEDLEALNRRAAGRTPTRPLSATLLAARRREGFLIPPRAQPTSQASQCPTTPPINLPQSAAQPQSPGPATA